jgi:hypothetical protein
MTDDRRADLKVEKVLGEITEVVAACRAHHTEELTKATEQVRMLGEQLGAATADSDAQMTRLSGEVQANRVVITDLRDALTGSPLHPNGLAVKIKHLEDSDLAIVRRLDAWENRAKGFAAAIALTAGVVGGALAAAVNAIFGG